jgi:hypothetical protein
MLHQLNLQPGVSVSHHSAFDPNGSGHNVWSNLFNNGRLGSSAGHYGSCYVHGFSIILIVYTYHSAILLSQFQWYVYGMSSSQVPHMFLYIILLPVLFF